MDDDLVFYTNPMSRGRLVRWMLEEVGAPYRTELVEYGPPMKADAYRAINPMGKVPALRHGGTVVTETVAICAYLADAFPAAELAPPPADRGAYYRWLFFAAGPLDMAFSFRRIGFEPAADAEKMLGHGTYAATVATLEHAVAGDAYVAGAQFSAADVCIGAFVGWGLETGLLDERPAFADYWSRVSDRDAYRRATAIDDAAMAAVTPAT